MKTPSPESHGGPPAPSGADRYLDACATTPPAPEVLGAMARAQAFAWGNPSSLHGFGLAAAEVLERSRQSLANLLGAEGDQLVFTSGGSEAIHTAVLGAAAGLAPGRLLISAVEHPATEAAAARLAGRGWQLERLPVDRRGLVEMERFAQLLLPPTRLVSVIWGQSEVGALQPVQRMGELCRQAGVLLHVDAVQVVGHRPLSLAELPVDLLSCTAHKLQGPRGIGALLLRPGLGIEPLIAGAQEGGRRGGTESVVLAAGFARALQRAIDALRSHGGRDPVEDLRNRLWQRLSPLPGVRLSGPDPWEGGLRLPHHLSLLVASPEGHPLDGRSVVRELWREGWATSSGSACRNAAASGGAGAAGGSSSASPVLQAMGYDAAEASSGLRLSLGSWLTPADLEDFPEALRRVLARLAARRGEGARAAGTPTAR